MKSSNPISSLFGHSPIKPLQQHMAIVDKCVSVVPELFEALIDGDQAAVERSKDQIFALEQSADELKNELRSHLPKSLFMPVDRRDILDLLDSQDSIADTAQDIAGLVIERQMTVPSEMADGLRNLVARCVDTCKQTSKIIGELDELLETGFGGRDAARVEQMTDTLNLIEDETDDLGIALAQALFKIEDDMKPVSVIFWYTLIEWIGDLADHAEKVGNRLRLLIAR